MSRYSGSAVVLLSVLFFTASAADRPTDAPSVRYSMNHSNLYGGQRGAIQANTTDIKWVLQLGKADSLEACGNLCSGFKNTTVPTDRCYSFTYIAEKQRWGEVGGCYGKTDPAWSPFPNNDGVDCGFVEWPCDDDMGCSLNGKCGTDGSCACSHGWTGKRCETLKLAPVDRNVLGFNPQVDGKNMSSWGGSIQQVDGKWHLWAVLLSNHCGIGSYLLNSGVVHATSEDSVLGPYTEQDRVFQPFSHEPVVVRAPTGELVMASVNGDYGTNFSACQCVDGSTTKSCIGCNNSCFYQKPTISISKSVNGPWASRDMYLTDNHGENPSIWIEKSGAAWGMGRGGMAAYSPDWRNASAWVHGTPGDKPTFIAGSPDSEDPMLYQDEDGNFHALLHSLDAPHYSSAPWENMPVGQHAYSKDGLAWYMSGTAYTAAVNTTDGQVLGLTRRERPHMVFEEGTRKPIALVNSAQEGDCGMGNGDRSFTIVQGILP